MKTRTQMVMLAIACLIIGGATGYTVALNRANQRNFKQLNTTLSEIWVDLYSAQQDLVQSSDDPTTPEELGFEYRYKANVAKASALWEAITPTLISRGLSPQDVYFIGGGLNIIWMNILPPYGLNPTSSSVERAHIWITMFEKSLYAPNPPVTFDYFQLLKNHLKPLVDKYASFSADPNFQVPQGLTF